MKFSPTLIALVLGFCGHLMTLNEYASQNEKKRIVFFGDSITAGYGLSQDQAFPALIQERLDSLKLSYTTVNAGLSGETSAGGLSRIDWILKTKPDIFFLELGGNDGLRGLSLQETRKNLVEMVAKVRASNPKAIVFLAGMQIPPNLGTDYREEFKSLYPTVAKETKTKLIPFLLEDVGGDPELNLPDGIHPNVEGHKVVAETVWKYLRPYLD